MKKLITSSIVLATLLLIIIVSCKKKETTPTPAPTPPPCNYVQWTGTGNCSSGYYPVYTGICAPIGSPFWVEGGTSCYASCETASKYANGKTIYRYNDGASGGTSTGGTTTGGTTTGGCNYTQWSGTSSCANTGYYPVYTGKCCGSAYPFYNVATGQCYQTCTAAYNANPNGQIYRYNDGGSGTTTGGTTTGGTTTGGTTTGGTTTNYALFYTTNCNCGTITIKINGNYVGSLSSCYTSGQPNCTSYNNALRVPISGTGNTWSATSTGNCSWSGNFVISGCTLIKLP